MSNFNQKNICSTQLSTLTTSVSQFCQEVAASARQHQPINLSLDQQQLALFLAVAPRAWPKQRIWVLMDGSKRQLQKFHTALAAWNKVQDAHCHWQLITDTLSEQEKTGLVQTALTRTFHTLLSSKVSGQYYLLSLSTLPVEIPHPKAYHQTTLSFTVKDTVGTISDCARDLVNHGYQRWQPLPARSRLEPGSFRVRGEQIDIAGVAEEKIYTLTFHRHSIEQITQTNHQRAITITHCDIPPVLFPTSTVALPDFIRNDIVIRPNWAEEYQGQPTIIYDALQTPLHFPWHSTNLLAAENQPKHWYILATNPERLRVFCQEHQLTSTICSSPLADIPLHLAHDNSILASEATILGTHDHELTPLSRTQGLLLVAVLTVGKPAVHRDHGIGVYEGLHRRNLHGSERDYLLLRYAEGDALFVPVEFAHKVTAYLGHATPVLHRLSHSLPWLKTRQKAREEAEILARELLQIAGLRHARQRAAYELDPRIDTELEQTFAYDLTPDQDIAWQEVRADLQKTTPLDRLIVGDVGFGKTEIALRAAYHVAHTGSQVAIIAPTTLLVQQHFDTFCSRLATHRSQIGMLSRFLTPREQQTVRERIAAGQLTIVIGTHALLSSKIHWPRLGLVIIDEEQRFGVRHKEHFKKIRADIDVLSLSATPIPRTLSMALTGLRDLSVISTAPTGRKSVKTIVAADTDTILKKAIADELARQGQIYVVSHHIKDLPRLATRIKKILPTARLACAHGQLPERDLAAVMHQFDTGQLDILVSSTIIENGLDLPNANTLIVAQSTHFGLSDLYQLRGRVGRRTRQGYAYFLYRPGHLTTLQRQRLSALTEASRLGSGWELAQRDLEMRGAGNFLGAEQSGSANAVGVQLYLDLVHEARDSTTKTHVHRHEVDITLPLVAFISDTYITNLDERTAWYQRLTRARTLDDLKHEITRLTHTFGPLPAEAQNLMTLLQLQHAAANFNITRISHQTITPPGAAAFSRLTIEGKNLPALVQRLNSLGTWSVKNNTLSLDMKVFNQHTIDDIKNCLLA